MAVETPIKTAKVRRFPPYVREIIAAVEGGMSGRPNGHRTKRCEVEACDVPHIPCFVRVGVGRGEEFLPHLTDGEEAVVRHDHILPALPSKVYCVLGVN